MLESLDQFTRRLTDSGLLSVKQLDAFCDSLPPTERPVEADQLRRQLVERDVLTISVWRQPELSVPEVAVRLDGRISVPLLDDVQAAGYTPVELKEIITEQLEEYVAAPHVTVVVRQSNSKIVYVLGEVAKEGPVVLFPDMRVIDAIAVAGGFHPFSARDRIKVIRNQNGGGPVEFLFNYDAFVDGDNLEQNILLLPGDRIIVPEAKPFWSR